MRSTRPTLLYSLLVAAFLVPACEKKSTEATEAVRGDPAIEAPVAASPATQPAPATQPSPTSLSVRKTAIALTKHYLYADRADFAADMQRDLDVLKGTLQSLFAKIDASNEKAETKAATRAKVVALVNRAAGLTSDLDKVRDVLETGWEQTKAGFKKSNDDFKASVAVARTWLSDKIAP